jgi:hypothetical protein
MPVLGLRVNIGRVAWRVSSAGPRRQFEQPEGLSKQGKMENVPSSLHGGIKEES